MIKFSCKNCAQQISIPEVHAGKRGKCPKCGKIILVPDKSTIVTFRCGNCGHKISVPKIHTGRKGKCPKCNNIVLVPKVDGIKPVTRQTEPSASEIISGDSILDPHHYDIAQESKAAGDGTVERIASDKALEELQRLQGSLRREEPEPLPERKLPWYIDIVIYPTSKAGLTMLGIFIGVPLLMEAFVQVLFLFAGGFPPFLVFAVLFLVVSLIVNIIIRLYRYWYISECIRDSAEGQIRAPETVATTPGLWELFSIFLKIFVCIVVLSAPMYFYLLKSMGIERSFGSMFSFTLFFVWTVLTEVGRSGITFHLLLFLAVFFFPMTILSVVMFDSYRGLNPLLIVRSIFNMFAPYCGLILVLCVLWLPVVLIRKFIVTQVVSFRSSLFLYLPRAVSIYLMLVGAHLLGRFYWKYQEKLNWEV